MGKKSVNWLIEKTPFEEDIEPLLTEIENQGHNLKLIKYKPFESGNYRNLYNEKDCVIFYGSINLARQLQRETPWVPGPVVNFRNYNCSTYYAHWGKYLLNNDYVMMPYAELCRRRHQVCEMLGHATPEKSHLFIRPDDGCKTFGGHCVDEKDFKRLDGPVGPMTRPDTLIVAASPKSLYYEWRMIICDGKAISGSQYKLADKLVISSKIPNSVWDKANEIASSDWQPDRLYTLDLCNWGPTASHDLKTGCNDIYLLESNSFACAGLYDSNPEPIVREASRVALEEWQDIYEKE